MVVGKEGKKIGVLALEIETLLGKKTVFVNYWFDIDRLKADEVELLIYWGS